MRFSNSRQGITFYIFLTALAIGAAQGTTIAQDAMLQASQVTGDVALVPFDSQFYSDLKAGPAGRVISVPLASGETVLLDVKRFEVFGPECRFLEMGSKGAAQVAAPDVALLRGTILGDAQSHVFLALASNGTGNGYIDRAGERFFIATQHDEIGRMAPGAITIHRQPVIQDAADEIEQCGVNPTHDRRQPLVPGRGSPQDGRGARMAKVAIDADQKFVQLFRNTADANAYVVQLVAATSDIYLRDLNFHLRLDFVRLWPNGGEPFSATDLGGFSNYWQTNEDPDQYNFIHMYSGSRATSYAGIAFVGGTCMIGRTYGISAFLNGTFPPSVGPPSLENWDVIVPTHEMGHNGGTFHTHDGYSPTIDNCGNGTPSRGTIMSYCHTHPGGTLNVDMWMHRRVEDTIEMDIAGGDCFEYDCNGNNVSDAVDIAGGALDVNLDGIPDSCQDCNQNGILDPIDPAADVNGNGIPDSCEPDCNANGLPDSYECGNNPSIDLDGNNTPDSCQADCNANAVADFLDVRTGGGFVDFDRNSVPDVCQDCDRNGASDWIDLGRPKNMYVADRADFVREYHAASGYPVQNLGGGAVVDPYDCIFGADRQLYVASFGNDRIVRINPDTGASSIFVSPGVGGLDGPSGLVFGPNGNLFVTSQISSSVIQYDGATGALVGTLVAAGSGGLSSPWGLTFGPNGNLFVSSGNNTVIQFNGATGALVGTFVSIGSGGLNGPRGLAFLPDGRLLVASFSNSRLLHYNGVTGAPLGQFNDGPTMDGAWGVRLGPDGRVYAVRSFSTIRVQQYTASGFYLRSFVRADPPLLSPTGLAFRPGITHDCNANGQYDACEPITSDLDLFVTQVLEKNQDPLLVCMFDQNSDGLLNGGDISGIVRKLLAMQ